MISSFSNISGTAQFNYGPSTALSSSVGNLYVPVKPSLVVYTQFEHVKGIAADSSSGGINISKIKILNTLIDRLIELKQTPDIQKDVQVSDNQVDALIDSYQTKIQQAVTAAKSNPYAVGGSISTQAGALFSIAA